jgi:hypothetical protein
VNPIEDPEEETIADPAPESVVEAEEIVSPTETTPVSVVLSEELKSQKPAILPRAGGLGLDGRTIAIIGLTLLSLGFSVIRRTS